MTEKHYDVVVLGRGIGALTCAALLARRDFRVLVLGQGARAPSYRLGRHVLRRSAFTMLAASSPAWKRVLTELAQSQTWRRRAEPLDPMLDLLMKDRRIEVPPDLALFTREIEREFPEVRRVVDDLYTDLARVNAAADAAFEKDAVWPPGTFWERRETGRLAAPLPYARAEPGFDLLADFPAAHPYRAIMTTLARFASDLSAPSGALPPFALARLHGAWTRGLFALARGEDDLADFLLDRIAAHGGTCRLAERATQVVVRGGAAAGVVIGGEPQPTGASFVVTDGTGEELADLARGAGLLTRAQREWPHVSRAAARFVVSIVVGRGGLPAVLAREAFVVPGAPSARTDRPIHLVRMDPAAEPEAPAEARGESLLVAEVLLPLGGPSALALGEVREQVVDALVASFPFLARHLVVADSPHDGRPAWVYEGGRRVEVERIHLTGATTTAEAMAPQWRADPPGYLGLSGEPVRGPIARTFLAGPTVLPALGQEGQLLAAWGAARLITRTDRQKEKMRRAMWSKVEIG